MEYIFAYIDPGSGSLVIQALIAGIVAIPVIFRRQLARVVRSIRGSEAASTETAGHDDISKGA